MDRVVLLVKFKHIYKDEFDVEGWLLMTDESWEGYKENWKAEFDNKQNISLDYGLSSHETIYWNSYKDFINCFYSEVVSNDEVKVLNKLFGNSYGVFPEL